MLNVFSIVVQQFPDIRHHRTLIGIIERNQRRRAGVLHLLLLTGIPDTGDRLHLHRTLYFKTGISWQGGNAVVLLLQPFNPLFPRPRGDRSRRFQAFFQLRQDLVRREIFNDVLVGPAEAQRGGMAQYRQRAVGIQGDQPRKLAMHPFKTGSRCQPGLNGYNPLKGGFQRIDMRNLRLNSFTRCGIRLQADDAGQANGGLTAAIFGLLLDEKATIVLQRHFQRRLANMLRHLNGVQRVVFCAFCHLGQGKDAGGQQAAVLKLPREGQ